MQSNSAVGVLLQDAKYYIMHCMVSFLLMWQKVESGTEQQSEYADENAKENAKLCMRSTDRDLT